VAETLKMQAARTVINLQSLGRRLAQLGHLSQLTGEAPGIMRGFHRYPLIPPVARLTGPVTAAPAWSSQLLCAFSDAAGTEG
jgi:hypothetical protein